MMDSVVDIFVAVVFFIATVFLFLAALGVWIMPTMFMQAHCASLASTLGVFLAFVAIFFLPWDLETRIKIILVPVFIFLTSPVSTHLLTRAVKYLEDPDDET